MRIPYSLILFAAALFGFTREKSRPPFHDKPSVSFYKLSALTLEGDTVEFSSFKGKKILIVNTASKCGYTPQYESLEKLHKKYGDKVVVLAFPSNDFGKQEPGDKKEIKEFCKQNYGVSFTVFEKSVVKGEGKHPVYQWLTSKELNGWNTEEPGWNFCKYLINEKGELIKFYSSGVDPMSKQMLEEINS